MNQNEMKMCVFPFFCFFFLFSLNIIFLSIYNRSNIIYKLNSPGELGQNKVEVEQIREYNQMTGFYVLEYLQAYSVIYNCNFLKNMVAFPI